MKKINTSSKSSLKNDLKNRPLMTKQANKRQQTRNQQNYKRSCKNLRICGQRNIDRSSNSHVKCCHCSVMVQRDLFKLHSNVCEKRLSKEQNFEKCKKCEKKIPLHLLMSHVNFCVKQNGRSVSSGSPRKLIKKQHEYFNMSKDLGLQYRNNKNKSRSKNKISKQHYDKNSQKKINPYSQNVHRCYRLQGLQQETSKKSQIKSKALQTKKTLRSQPNIRSQHRLQQNRQTTAGRQIERDHTQQRQIGTAISQQRPRRQRRSTNRSSNRRMRRHHSMPGAGLLPVGLLRQIHSGFQELGFRGNSFEQNIQHLSSHLGYVMDNLSAFLPLQSHRHRVIWYEEDIYQPDDESAGSDSDSEKGLDPEEIEEIPVQQFISHQRSDTTKYTLEKLRKSCSVCLSDFRNGQSIKVLPCMHKFHQECIDRWLEMKGNCPVCREDLRA